jgi:A/G-specific adenine glycosylase
MKHSDKKIFGYFGSKFSSDERFCPGIQEFQERVLSYYEEYGRDMPWRHTSDPYQILVSEIMLQQTQVERVILKFPEFITTFPNFSALATATLGDVLTAWQGMGYNRRAISLQKCAVRVLTEQNGILPADVDKLVTFPGIGRATASSIAAFAFNMPVVFIETNIRRVFIHFFFTGTETVSDSAILPLVEQTLYRTNPRIWYWALMDLGSALKKVVANPNRRSAHYTKQSPFEGSDRKIRGMIIRMILKTPEIMEEEFLCLPNADPARIKKILSSLESEGFLSRDNSRFFLSQRTGLKKL